VPVSREPPWEGCGMTLAVGREPGCLLVAAVSFSVPRITQVGCSVSFFMASIADRPSTRSSVNARSSSTVSVFPTAPSKEARLGIPPRFPAVVAASQINQRHSRGRRSDRSGGTMSAPSPLSIPTVFRPVATSAQRTPTAWAQGGVRVQRAADLGGRRSIVGAVSPSIPRLRRSSTMSSCRGWPNVSR
jgi:hypothetical protein